jgi:hypothetical protein
MPSEAEKGRKGITPFRPFGFDGREASFALLNAALPRQLPQALQVRLNLLERRTVHGDATG